MNKLDEALDKIKLGDSVGHGLVRPTIGATDYILGASPLPRVVLQPNGQWTDWLPANELQNRGRFETYACGIYNTLACIEILQHRLLDVRTDYAERPIAIHIKLAPPGSDPSKNIEAIRKETGLVPEEMLPFDDTVQTIEQYMSGLTEQIKVEGKKFIAEYKVGWEFVFDWNVHDLAEKQKRLMEALKYSPVGIAVDAWHERNGMYFNKGYANHWTVLIGYQENKYWLVQDSYSPHIKKIEWDSVPDFAIRYHLERRPKEEQIKLLADTINSNRNWVYDLTTKLAEFFLSLFELNTLKKNDMPEPKIEPVIKTVDKLDLFCTAIKKHEGYFPPSPKYPTGSRSWKNNNPGNVKYSIVGYLPIYKTVRKDDKGFAVFETYDLGWLYLKNYVKSIVTGHSRRYPKGQNTTIMEFTATYAPSFENDTKTYANILARSVGGTVNTKLSEFIVV